VLLGDVTGHGAAAAMITGCVASSYLILASRAGNPDLDEVISDLNSELRSLAQGVYCMTLSAMVLKEDHLRWYTAAALPIMILTPEGEIDVLTARGHPLGSLSGTALGTRDYTVRRGSRVALFTDGLVELERRPGRQLGLRWVKEALLRTRGASVDEAIQMIISDVRIVADDSPLDDDISLVLLDFHG
jgi:sigma-B regulation protein RsbU (phosphoserine phosphatase)